MSDDSLATRSGSFARASNWLAVWRHPRAWLVFSIVYGVVGPLVCFWIATRQGMFGRGTLAFDSYVLIVVCTLILWLTFRRERPWCDGLASGVFLSAVVFAIPFAAIFGSIGTLVLGGSIIEASADGLLWGVLGVTPLFTLVVYAVNGSRAARAPSGRSDSSLQIVGFTFPVAVPVAVFLWVATSVRATETAILLSTRDLGELRLERWPVLAPGFDWPTLRAAYGQPFGQELDHSARFARDRRIEEAFEALTGTSLDYSD